MSLGNDRDIGTELRLLVIVRHGDQNPDGELSPVGQEKMRRLAVCLKRLAPGAGIRLVSSPVKRASQSARILSEYLEAPLEEDEALHPLVLRDDFFLKFVEQRVNGSRVMVVVTHKEYAAFFANSYVLLRWGVDEWPEELKRGEAYLISSEKKSIELIRNT